VDYHKHLDILNRELQTLHSQIEALQQELQTCRLSIENQVSTKEAKLVRELADTKARLGEKIIALSKVTKELEDLKKISSAEMILSSKYSPGEEIEPSPHLAITKNQLMEECQILRDTNLQLDQHLKTFTLEVSQSMQALTLEIEQLKQENAALKQSHLQQQHDKNLHPIPIPSSSFALGETTDHTSETCLPMMSLPSSRTTSAAEPYCDYCEAVGHLTINCEHQDEVW
jgi:serine phosphatase RsbU (regulator of sigma subunit)